MKHLIIIIFFVLTKLYLYNYIQKMKCFKISAVCAIKCPSQKRYRNRVLNSKRLIYISTLKT